MTLCYVFFISKTVCIYTSETYIEAQNTFCTTVTVLGQRSAWQISSAEKLGVLVQL